MRVSIVPALLALSGCQPASPPSQPAPAAPAEEVLQAVNSQTRADELLRDYRADADAAIGRIGGKSVAVFGRVREVDANLAGVSRLSLVAGNGPDDQVACSFDKSQAGTLVDVQPGDWAVVAGVGQSAAGLDNCRLLKTFAEEQSLQRWLRAAKNGRPGPDLH